MIGAALRLNDRLWPALTLALLTAITALSLTTPIAADVAGADKVQHLLAYGALAFPAALARARLLPALLAGFVLWSGAIELIQPQVGRVASLADLGANAAGLALGTAAALALRRLAGR